MRVLLTAQAEGQHQKFTAAERRRIMRRLEAEAKRATEAGGQAVGEGPLPPPASLVVIGDLAVAAVLVKPEGLLVTSVQRRSP